MIKLLLVDDHTVVGQGTKYLLEETGEITVTLCSSSIEVLEKLESEEYDVYMLDLYMPDQNGLDLAKDILKRDQSSKVIICTGFDTSSLFNSFVTVGISGYISKTATSQQFITLIKCVMNGETVLPLELYKQLRRVDNNVMNQSSESVANVFLTQREEKVLIAISKGLKNREIADELLMSQRSVEYCLTNIYKKLNATSRSEALLKAEQNKLIHSQLSTTII